MSGWIKKLSNTSYNVNQSVLIPILVIGNIMT